jgi:hypothetical protein
MLSLFQEEDTFSPNIVESCQWPRTRIQLLHTSTNWLPTAKFVVRKRAVIFARMLSQCTADAFVFKVNSTQIFK